jgi:hypothetical protein
MKRAFIGLVCAVVALTVAVPAMAGPKVEMEDGYFRVRFLCQPHYAFSSDTADEEMFSLRRARILIDGQIADGVTFFMETDGATAQFIQDAYVDFAVCSGDNHAVGVKTGLILLPFSYENRASAASLLGVDYNAESISLPNSLVWRNVGVEVHGQYADKVAVNAGVFDGNGAPDEGSPRVTGHIGVGLIGNAQSGAFYSQNRLKSETYVNVGAGIDSQSDASVSTNGTMTDNMAWVVDVQSCISLTDTIGLTVNGAYYDYDNDNVFSGSRLFVEAGLGCTEMKVQLTAKYAMSDPDGGSSSDDVTIGAHYFMKGNNIRGGIEYRFGDSDDTALLGLQFLL